MILEAELRGLAHEQGADLMLLDLDYSLGWFLAALGEQNLQGRLRFKGGTCLRKCYFPDYRFSEDLDFTAEQRLTSADLLSLVEMAARWLEREAGLDFNAAPMRAETITDEYGKESFQLRVYYRGPLSWAGSPRAVRLDVTRAEVLAFPSETHAILHPYSDNSAITSIRIPCYPLEEILAEKIRAIAGQRRFAISRDLYDIYQLLARGVELSDILPILPLKLEAKGLRMERIKSAEFEARRSAFEADWQRRLAYLVPHSQVVAFEDAWNTTVQIVRQIEE